MGNSAINGHLAPARRAPTAGYALAAAIGILGLSLAWAANGIFDRIDRTIALVERVPATLVEVNASADRLKGIMDDFQARMAAARASLPAVGTEVGEAGAKAVETMKQRLDRIEKVREEMAEEGQSAGGKSDRLRSIGTASRKLVDAIRDKESAPEGAAQP